MMRGSPKNTASTSSSTSRKLGCRARVYEGLPPLHVAEISSIEEIQEREDAIAGWLRSLPKPVGLMAYNDRCAYQVIAACGSRGIAVPDEVAVIGVDNDEVLCELSDPPLSSVDPNAQRIGYETAALLHRLILGDPPQKSPVLVQPLGVIARESTDAIAIADSQTAAAVRYIRRYACDGLQIKELLRNVEISRSTLERRFARYLGRSPRAEITRVQLRRVKELLSFHRLSPGEDRGVGRLQLRRVDVLPVQAIDGANAGRIPPSR